MKWFTTRAGEEPRWTYLFYMCYCGFLFVQPAMSNGSVAQWLAAFTAVAIFVPLYLLFLGSCGLRAFLYVLAIAVLGYAFSPFNTGASAFLIYAAALLGFVFEPRIAFAGLGVLMAGVALESWLFHLIVWFWAPTMLMIVGIGSMNIHAGAQKRADAKLRRAQGEIEHLAKVAERERIARDLHDVLGHTLSVIVLKSELASKLLDRDIERARREIGELEQIARDALADVRQAIGGYRAGSLTEELDHARSTLRSAGIQVEDSPAPTGRSAAVKPSPAQETVLALIMREAVTNIVRHSGARHCRIIFDTAEPGMYRLEISDDGRGGSHIEGNGLTGMRERVEALNGTLVIDGSNGTAITVGIPLSRKQERIA